MLLFTLYIADDSTIYPHPIGSLGLIKSFRLSQVLIQLQFTVRHRSLKIGLAIATDCSLFTDSRQEAAMLVLKASGRFR